MRRVTLYPYPKVGGYYPVNLYGLLVYNHFGYVGNSSSTMNVQLRRTSDNAVMDFLFDRSKASSIAAVNLWRGGSDIRVVRLYNEGLGGADYDLTQLTASVQPYVDTTNWIVDFSGGNYNLSRIITTPITNGNSVAMVSYESQSTIDSQGIFTESWNAATTYNLIFSDTRSTGLRLNNYRVSNSNTFLSFPSQQPTNTNKVLAFRRNGTTNTGYSNGVLIDTQTSVAAPSTTSTLYYGNDAQFNYANIKGQGYIMHDTELTPTIIQELSNHLAI